MKGGGGSDDGFFISESENNQMYQPLGYYTFEDLTNGDPDADEDIANNWMLSQPEANCTD